MGIEMFVVSLKTVMHENGVSIAELSRKSGVPYGTLYDLVSGRTSPKKITVDTSIAIASALDTSVEKLMGIEKRASENLSADEIALLTIYRKGDSTQKSAILASAEGIVSSFKPRYEFSSTLDMGDGSEHDDA